MAADMNEHQVRGIVAAAFDSLGDRLAVAYGEEPSAPRADFLGDLSAVIELVANGLRGDVPIADELTPDPLT